MKILFFASYFYPYLSGITTYPYHLLTFLANQKKHEVLVLCFHHDSKLAKFEKHKGLTIRRLPYLLRLSKGFISPQSVFYFFQGVCQSDVVILNIPNFEGLLLALIAKLMGKKVVSIFHCRVHLGKSYWQRILNLFLNISVQIQLKLSDVITAYTKDYLLSLPEEKKYLPKVKFILPPVPKLPVDQEYLSQLKKKKDKKKWIGFSGRVAREKGLTFLIKAIAQLQQHTKFSLELVLAGPYGKKVIGEEKYYQHVLSLLNQIGIKYSFLGILSRGKLGAFYQSIDCLVLPSINQTEAFGMVQVEALQAGKPVIASDLPGVRQPVKLTGLGEIVEPGNILALTQALEKIITTPDKYISEQKIKKTRQIFDVDHTYQFYNKLLTHL